MDTPVQRAEAVQQWVALACTVALVVWLMVDGEDVAAAWAWAQRTAARSAVGRWWTNERRFAKLRGRVVYEAMEIVEGT